VSACCVRAALLREDSRSSPPFRPRAAAVALVKLSGGQYMRFKHDGITDMDSAGLLETLAASKGFSNDLAGVKQGQCTVAVGACARKRGPTAEEEAAAEMLVGADTIGELLERGSPPILFIRVALPAAAGESSRSYLALARLSRHALTVELRSGV